MRFRDLTQVQAELERRLGRPVAPEVLALLNTGHLRVSLRDVMTGTASMEDLVLEVQDLERALSRPPERRPVTRKAPTDPRLDALAQIIALEASKRRDVQRFRAKYLRGGLLTHAEAVQWIQARAGDAPPVVWVKLPLNCPGRPWKDDPNWWRTLAASAEPVGVSTLARDYGELEYLNEAGEVVIIKVHEESVLHDLARLSGALTYAYGWARAEATLFVLTGRVPTIPTVQGYLTLRRRHPALSTIQIEASIRLPRAKMAAYYSEAQREALRLLGRRRERAMSKKERASLAVFLAEHGDGRSWRELMDLWNRQAKGTRKRYNDPRIFRRDALLAYRQVTGADYVPGSIDSLEAQWLEKREEWLALQPSPPATW